MICDEPSTIVEGIDKKSFTGGCSTSPMTGQVPVPGHHYSSGCFLPILNSSNSSHMHLLHAN